VRVKSTDEEVPEPTQKRPKGKAAPKAKGKAKAKPTAELLSKVKEEPKEVDPNVDIGKAQADRLRYDLNRLVREGKPQAMAAYKEQKGWAAKRAFAQKFYLDPEFADSLNVTDQQFRDNVNTDKRIEGWMTEEDIMALEHDAKWVSKVIEGMKGGEHCREHEDPVKAQVRPFAVFVRCC
jgi:hypothetical protein